MIHCIRQVPDGRLIAACQQEHAPDDAGSTDWAVVDCPKCLPLQAELERADKKREEYWAQKGKPRDKTRTVIVMRCRGCGAQAGHPGVTFVKINGAMCHQGCTVKRDSPVVAQRVLDVTTELKREDKVPRGMAKMPDIMIVDDTFQGGAV